MIGLLDRFVRGFLILLVIAMIATVTWQVLSRYALRAPSSVTEEIARFQLIWLGLFGAVYTFRNRMHVGIDVLTASLTGKKRMMAEIVSLAATGLFAALVLVFGGGRLVTLTHTLSQSSPALGISMAWVYAIIPLSGLLIVIYAIHFIRETLHGHIEQPHTLGDLPPGLGDPAKPDRSNTEEPRS